MIFPEPIGVETGDGGMPCRPAGRYSVLKKLVLIMAMLGIGESNGGENAAEAGKGEIPAGGKCPEVRLEAAATPTGRFQLPGYSVRESSVVRVGGKWLAYADAVSWKNPYHPNTYSSAIFAFERSADGSWPSRGEVIRGGVPGAWDHGGAATPGVVCRQGRILLFYSGRQNGDGSGHRYIGLAVAAAPGKPFVKLPDPVTAGPGHRDDPCPVLSPDGRRILLYYRLALGGRYAIRLASAPAPEGPWREEGEVIPAAGNIRAVETTDAKRMGRWVVLAVMEHDRRPGKGIQTALYVSTDGHSFIRTAPPTFEKLIPDLAKDGGMAAHLSFHVNGQGKVEAFGMTRRTGVRDAYTRFVYPVHAFHIEEDSKPWTSGTKK
jgi:hypothetical protein